MATKIDPPIEIHLFGTEKPTVFRSVDAIERWVDQELEFWRQDGADIDVGNRWLQGFYRFQIDSLMVIKKNIDAILNGQIGELDSGVRSNIEGELRGYGHPPQIPRKLHGGESAAHAVRRLLNERPELGAIVLAMFQGHTKNFQTSNSNAQQNYPLVIQGIAVYELLAAGIHPEMIEAHRQALERVNGEALGQVREAREQHAALQKSTERLDTAGQSQLRKQKERFDALITVGKEGLDDLISTYREQLGLQAPVAYWSNKGDRHFWTILGAGSAFLLAVGSALGYLNKHWNEIIALSAPVKDATLGSILVVAVPVFLGVWVLRILSRIFLNSLDLYNDAKERSVMISTYLALVEDGKASEEDRILILSSIFRPSGADGGEDAVPPSVIEAIIQRVQK